MPGLVETIWLLAFAMTGVTLWRAFQARRRARLLVLLAHAEGHVVATGEQLPGSHLTQLLSSLSGTGGTGTFRIQVLLQLSRCQARLRNFDEMDKLSMRAAAELGQMYRPGEAPLELVSMVGSLQASTGEVLTDLGEVRRGYEKLKLAAELFAQSPEEHVQQLQDLRRSAKHAVETGIELSRSATGASQRRESVFALFDMLPFELTDSAVRQELQSYLSETLPGAFEGLVYVDGEPASSSVRLLESAIAQFDSNDSLGALLHGHAVVCAERDGGRNLRALTMALGVCANSCLALSRPTDALLYLDALEKVAADLPAANASRGNVLRSLGDGWGAIDALQRAATAARLAGDVDLVWRTRADLAVAWMSVRAESPRAWEEVRLLTAQAAFIGLRLSPMTMAQLLMTRAWAQATHLLVDRKDVVDPDEDHELERLAQMLEDHLQTSPVLYRQLRARVPEATALEIVGECLRLNWRGARAALDLPSRAATALLYGLFRERYERNDDAAAALYEEVLASLEVTRSNILELGHRRTFVAQHNYIFDRLVACYCRTGRIEEAFAASERARARSLLELMLRPRTSGATPPSARAHVPLGLQGLLLQRRLAWTALQASCTDPLEVSKRLTEGELMLELHFSATETFLFAIDSNGLVDCYCAPYGHVWLEQLLERQGWHTRRAELETLASSKAPVDPSLAGAHGRFYDALTVILDLLSQSLLAEARGVRSDQSLTELICNGTRSRFSRLIIVSHRRLWNLPLHCLSVAGSRISGLLTASGVRVCVSYAQSASAFLVCRARQRSNDVRRLAFAHPNYRGALAAWFGERHIYAAPADASVDSVLEACAGTGGEYALDVHFSAHAHFNEENPVASSLQIDSGTFVTLADILLSFRSEQVDTVLLSACSSAQVHVDPSADYLSLATGFLSGGARNVVGALWPVTTGFAQRFEQAYYAARPACSPSSALAIAVSQCEDEGSERLDESSAMFVTGAG